MDEDFDGIRYKSCNSDENVKYLEDDNIVLVTKSFDGYGIDKRLRECIRIGQPEVIDTTSVKPEPRISDLLIGKDI